MREPLEGQAGGSHAGRFHEGPLRSDFIAVLPYYRQLTGTAAQLCTDDQINAHGFSGYDGSTKIRRNIVKVETIPRGEAARKYGVPAAEHASLFGTAKMLYAVHFEAAEAAF